MIKDIFDTPEKINIAVANFKTLKKTLGWQLLTEIIQANIEELQKQILDGVEDETKETIERKRDKLKAYKEVVNTPDYWIKKFEPGDTFDGDQDDPYYTVESLGKERKKNNKATQGS